MIPPFDPDTGGLPPGDHQATLEEIRKRLGFTPRRRWLLKGLHAAVEAFWKPGIEEILSVALKKGAILAPLAPRQPHSLSR